MTYAPLRILAEEDEDLEVIAACLQDALIPLAGLTFNQEDGCFHLLAHRFCWESKEEEGDLEPLPSSRVLANLAFHNVTDVHKRDLSLTSQEELLNLLTIHRLGEENWVHLVFSGGAEVRLKIDQLKCLLSDIEDPHPPPHRPHHA